MPKKSNKLVQTHGKVETYQPTTLQQIWGDTGIGKYNTMNQDEYVATLNEMTKADLHAHAVKIGLIPVDNREQMVKRLVREFCKHVASYRQPISENPNREPSKELLKILSEGR